VLINYRGDKDHRDEKRGRQRMDVLMGAGREKEDWVGFRCPVMINFAR
jgi:hypothetical protein